MEIKIVQTTGVEVDEGGWKVDLVAIEDFMNAALADKSFGESVTTFYYGFELFDFEGQFKEWFDKIKDYSSYRPKTKGLVVNDQIDFGTAKSLCRADQLEIVKASILKTITRVGSLKRKPKDFDYTKFQQAVEELLLQYVQPE